LKGGGGSQDSNAAIMTKKASEKPIFLLYFDRICQNGVVEYAEDSKFWMNFP